METVMANTSLVNQLISDLRGADEQKQRHALYRLGQLREPTALPALLESLNHKDRNMLSWSSKRSA